LGLKRYLGIATEISFHILKTSEAICILLAYFTDIEAGGQAVADIVSAVIISGGMEIMNNLSINAVEQCSNH
jgi:glycolate oxidase